MDVAVVSYADAVGSWLGLAYCQPESRERCSEIDRGFPSRGTDNEGQTKEESRISGMSPFPPLPAIANISSPPPPMI